MKDKILTALKNYSLAICFLAIIGVLFLLNIRSSVTTTADAVKGLAAGSSASAFEQAYNKNIRGTNYFVTLNGGIERLLGRRNVKDDYLLDNGMMTYTIPDTDVSEPVSNTDAFSKALEEMGIPFVYVNALWKLDPDDKQLPPGVEDYGNENADRFINALRERNIACLDLRERERAEGFDHYSLFYSSDHHWTTETGFWAFTEIADYLEQQDSSFAIDERIKDISNYDLTPYKNVFLGSMGRGVGPLYIGKDDLTLITPKFDTHMRYYVPFENMDRVGTFRDSIVFENVLTDSNDFLVNRYGVYGNFDYDHALLENYSNEDGLGVNSTNKNILIIKDSFAGSVLPFLSLGYSHVDAIDLRLFESDLMKYIENVKPDYVIILYNPGALESSNLDMYQFE